MGGVCASVLRVISCDNRGQVVHAKKAQLRKCFLLWSAHAGGHRGRGPLLRGPHMHTGPTVLLTDTPGHRKEFI